MKKNIIIITSNRAEYGILKPLISLFSKSNEFKLNLIVSGAHVSKTFGQTYKEITKDGFKIKSSIECLIDNDSEVSVSKSMSILSLSLCEKISEIKPDCIILLGDRFETHACACVSAVMNVPIAHIQGGEITEGAVDDKLRHSITKLSNFHFVFTEIYKKRVIQMGENPNNVFNVGALNGDSLLKVKKLSKTEIEKLINFKIDNNTILFTFHSVTLEPGTSEKYIKTIMKVFEYKKELRIIFTKTNPDADGRIINSYIDKFVKNNNKRSIAVESLGHFKYINTLRHVSLLVGNSSSGIIETPFLSLPTINIGTRQKGRVRASNIIDCKCSYEEIMNAFKIFKSKKFLANLKNLNNPYKINKTSLKIYSILKKRLKKIQNKKSFYDI